jgi:hypothetical protein
LGEGAVSSYQYRRRRRRYKRRRRYRYRRKRRSLFPAVTGGKHNSLSRGAGADQP